jgi:NAD(P)H-hydrate epimerase
MRLISVSEAQKFDRLAQEKFGIPPMVLMENAGRSVAEEALKMLGKKKRVVVVCGVGNNGGDGFVAARHLLNAGKKVKVFIVGDEDKLKPDPRTNLDILRKIKTRFIRALPKTDLIIDAIFGIGLTSEVREPFFGVIDLMNRAKIPILAVDVPSGLDADSGKVLGAAIQAKRTVTFVAAKKGFYKLEGPKCCGKVIVKDIGARF